MPVEKIKTFDVTYKLADGAAYKTTCEGASRPGHYPNHIELENARRAAGIVLPSAPPGKNVWHALPNYAWDSRAGYVSTASTTCDNDSGLLYTTQVVPRAS